MSGVCIWLVIPLAGCLSVPSAERNGGDDDAAGDDDDADPNAPDAASTDATIVPSIFNGRFVLDPYFTPAGTCAEGSGTYNFRVAFDGVTYLVTIENANTDHSATFDEDTGHVTVASENDTYVSGHQHDEYMFDLQVSGTTVTGTGSYSLWENDVLTCTNPIDVNAGVIQP